MKALASLFSFLLSLACTASVWAQGAADAGVPAATEPAGSAFNEALAVSGQALIIIFIVMAAFGGMITLLGKLLPGEEE